MSVKKNYFERLGNTIVRFTRYLFTRNLMKRKIFKFLIILTVFEGIVLVALFAQGKIPLSRNIIPSEVKFDLSLFEITCNYVVSHDMIKNQCKIKCKKSSAVQYVVDIYNSGEYCGPIGLSWTCKESFKEFFDYAVETGNYHCN